MHSYYGLYHARLSVPSQMLVLPETQLTHSSLCMLSHADWQAVGPPHKQRYLQFTGQPAAAAPGAIAAAAAAAADGTAAEDAAAAGAEEGSSSAPSAGSLLAAVQREVFESGAFARLLRAMLDVQILKHAGEVRRFRAGERGKKGGRGQGRGYACVGQPPACMCERG